MQDTAFTELARVSFRLATLGIIKPDALKGLHPEYCDGIADIIAHYVEMAHSGDPWNPLTVPRKNQFVFVDSNQVKPHASLACSIDRLHLVTSAIHALKRVGITTIGQLLACGSGWLQEDVPYIGAKHARSIATALKKCGFDFVAHKPEDGVVFICSEVRYVRVATALCRGHFRSGVS